MSSVLLLVGCIGLDKVPARDSVAPDDGATLGGLSLDVTEIDFGAVPLGERASQDITFQSDEATTLDALLDDAAGVFEISATSLVVDGTGVLTVGFQPQAEGTFAGTLTLTVEGGDTLVVPIAGSGGDEGDSGGGDDSGGDDSGSQQADNGLVVDPDSYDFGEADLGEELSHIFTVRNEGDDDLMISDVDFSSGDFTVTGGTIQTPQLISPGGSKTVEVSFTPNGEGVVSGTMTLVADVGDVDVALSGEGVDLCDICAPIIDVSTGSDPYEITDFFSFMGAEDARTITIQNQGDEDLTVTRAFVNNDVIATCGEFTVSGFSGAETIGPWDTTSFEIAYSASETCLDLPSTDFDTNILHIYSSDPSQSDWAISLQGTGFSL